MKLIRTDYRIESNKDGVTTISMTIPYHMIAKLQLMGTIIQSYMLPINNSTEGISFILPKEYNGKANDPENIYNGSDFILAALQEIEGKYLSLIYAEGVKIDRNDRELILPICTAYRVIIECKNEMVDNILNSIKI